MIVGACLVMLAVVIVALAYVKRHVIFESTFWKRAEKLKWVGSVKFSILFFMAQTMNEFSIISAGNGDEGEFPQPASGFVSFLGPTNLDVLRLLPTGCLLPYSTFYHRLVIKTTAPMVVVALIWCYPLFYRLWGSPPDEVDECVRDSGRYTLAFLELVLPTVSSSIAQVTEKIDTHTHTPTHAH